MVRSLQVCGIGKGYKYRDYYRRLIAFIRAKHIEHEPFKLLQEKWTKIEDLNPSTCLQRVSETQACSDLKNKKKELPRHGPRLRPK